MSCLPFAAGCGHIREVEFSIEINGRGRPSAGAVLSLRNARGTRGNGVYVLQVRNLSCLFRYNDCVLISKDLTHVRSY